MKKLVNKKKIFFKSDNFNNLKFLKLVKKSNCILDFGCGEGLIKSKKKIFLYDKNKSYLKILKKKFKNKDNYIILNKPKFSGVDCILLNSVIQYINEKQLHNLKKKIIYNNIKFIIISDIPKFPRILEAILLIIFNPKIFFTGVKYFFIKEYRNLKFFYRSHKELKQKFEKNFTIQTIKNLNQNKIRYTLFLKLKK